MSILNFRRYGRVPVELQIKFYAPNADEPVTAFLSNISEEGASLICPFTIPIATILEFDVKLPKISQPVHIRSDILWARPIKENGQNVFAHGLIYKQLSIEDRERLHQYISHTMNY